jgi:ATP-binding cassette subfamily B protein
MTVIIVAHRLTTLKGCDLIIELNNGAIKNFYEYQDLVI